MTESDPSDFIDTFKTCLSLLTDATMKRICLLFYVSLTDIETKFAVSFMAVNISDVNRVADKPLLYYLVVGPMCGERVQLIILCCNFVLVTDTSNLAPCEIPWPLQSFLVNINGLHAQTVNAC